jgi:hypothetical protein
VRRFVEPRAAGVRGARGAPVAREIAKIFSRARKRADARRARVRLALARKAFERCRARGESRARRARGGAKNSSRVQKNVDVYFSNY